MYINDANVKKFFDDVYKIDRVYNDHSAISHKPEFGEFVYTYHYSHDVIDTLGLSDAYEAYRRERMNSEK